MNLRRQTTFPLPIGFDYDRTIASSALRKREQSSGRLTIIIIVAVVVALLVLSFLFLAIRSARQRRKNSKDKRSSFLKQVWSEWRIPTAGQTNYEQAASGEDADSSSDRRRSRGRPLSVTFDNNVAQSQTRTAGGQGNAAAVDRNTSVRSVMTLPAYRVQPSSTEQVLGREGERDGVDVVVDHPTDETQEQMREDEMEALYQVRLARRQEINEREERRRQRREARERNDVVALEEIRARARAASNNTLLDELRRDHDRIKETRQRAVSSVSYADLGVARHDGTRLRANSTESERVGLLSDAASIAATSTRSGAGSSLAHHRRDRSVSSAMSIDSDFPSPGLSRTSRADSRPDTPRLSTNTRAGSSPEIIEADLGDLDMPPHSPPGYDEVSLDEGRSGATTPHTEPPPDYPGPSAQRAERVAADMADLAEDHAQETRGRPRPGETPSARGVGGVPQLPSLRLQRLPQIVIDSSGARSETDR